MQYSVATSLMLENRKIEIGSGKSDASESLKTFHFPNAIFPFQFSSLRRMINSLNGRNSLQIALLGLLFFQFQGAVQGQTPNLSNPSACRLGLPITDNNCPDGEVFYQPNTFNINVANAPGSTLGIDVYLKEVHLLINHTWDNDLDITLVSPSGIKVLLSADNGGGDDNFGDTTGVDCSLHTVFTLGACRSISEGNAPFLDNPYAPEQDFYLFNDSLTNPNGTWQLQICDDAVNDDGTLEYINLVFEPISCLPVLSEAVLNIDTTAVTLGWVPGFCGTTIVEYGPVGFTPGQDSIPGAGGQVAFASCSPFILRGLQENTAYDIYLRRYCSETGGFSLNTCGVSALTSCQPPPISIIETFDEQLNCQEDCGTTCELTGLWRNAVSGDFDWIVGEGGTPTQGTGPLDDEPGGGKYVYLEATGSVCAPGAEAHLLSGCILLDKQGTDTCHVSFNYHMRGIDIGSLRLEISINGGFNWRSIWEKSGQQGTDWQKVYLSLADYSDGALLQFRFVGVKGSGSKGDIALDNIVFYGSQYLGYPDKQYFVDADDDGYGTPGFYVLSCSQNPPPNFVDNDQDCDDTDELINPGAAEIACDGKDNNCNGIDDDANLPPPEVVGDTICSGEVAQLSAIPKYGGFIFWYETSDGPEVVSVGDDFVPDLPENNSPVPVVHTFYAEEFAIQESGDCKSVTRAPVQVLVNPKPSLQIPEAPGICPGDSIDLASLNIEDANFTGATFSFHTDFPVNPGNILSNTSVSPLSTTFYYLQAINTFACSDEDSIAVIAQTGPSLSFSPADSFSICREGSTSVSVQANGGESPYSYFWSTGSNRSNLTVKAAFLPGTLDAYYLTVTDAEGCFSIDSVLVTTINSIDSVRVIVNNVTTCSGSDGEILMVPLSGQAPFTFSWTGSTGISGSQADVADTMRLTGLDQGAYRITITDSSPEACGFILRNVLVQGPAAVVNDIDVEAVSCYGQNDGGICLEVTGTAPSYLWSTGDTTLCVQGLAGGLYSVTITDDPCQTILTDILVFEPDSLVIKPSLTIPSCHDATDGAVEVAFFGGQAPYSLSWFNGQSRLRLPDLGEGAYALTLTDGNNCTETDTLLLFAPDSLQVQVDSFADMSCKGIPDGFIRVSGLGGTAPYTYVWNTGSKSSAIANLMAGTYTVTISDFNGCAVTQSFQVIEPESLSVFIVDTQQPLCSGDNTGSITVGAIGGTGPYTFSWAHGPEGALLSELEIGTYTLIARDAKGCESLPFTTELLPQITLNLGLNIVAPLCVGPETGSILLTPIGVGPFRFQWERGDTTALLANAGVGVYPVNIRDGQGCNYDTVFNIGAPQVFNLDVDESQPSCFGVADGGFDVLVLAGGTGILAVNWSDGATGTEREGLGPGNYSFVLSDAIGCRFASDTLTLVDPPKLRVIQESISAIACTGGASGSIETSIVGGTPPYQINWVGTNVISDDIFDLTAGNYRLRVSDANSCPIDTVFRITEPSPLTLDLVLLQGGGCDPTNAADTVVALVQGGTKPYRYSWSTGDTLGIIYDAPSGDYAFTVVDAAGCEISGPSIKVRERTPPLVLQKFIVEGPKCYGDNAVKATVKIAGGSGLFRYHFRPTLILNNVASDSVTVTTLPINNSYSVTVTDLKTGCQVSTGSGGVSVPPPLLLSIDKVEEVNCAAGFDGGIKVSVQGGIAPYTYSWRDSTGVEVSTLQDLANVKGGRYTLYLADANQCMDTLMEEIPEVNAVIRIENSTIDPVSCKGDSDGGISINLSGGERPFQYKWNTGQTVEDLSNIPAGQYSLTVTDADTCKAIFDGFVVPEPVFDIVLADSVRQLQCFGDQNAFIGAAVSGGQPPYSYRWLKAGNVMEGQIDSILNNIGKGSYRLEVKDAGTCVRTFDFEIIEPARLNVGLSFTAPMPPNYDDGKAEARPEGGTPDYSYLWSTGATTSIITDLVPATYTVTVTDANHCTREVSILINDAPWPSWVQHLEIYPNPSKGWLFIDYTLEKALPLDIQCFNSMGQLMSTFHVAPSRGQTLQQDWSVLPAGVYWIAISSERERILLKKWVINP
ncbi:MAG: T9SS type A sorting domain-containing protein [Saprospiraceae bacterium]